MQMILPREACAGDKRVLRREHMHWLPVVDNHKARLQGR